MTTEAEEVKAEVIEPDALAKIPEPEITYTLPKVDVGSMKAIDKDIGSLREFCEGIEIDPSDKEQVKSLRAFCTDINKAAGVFDAKRKGMDKDIKSASSEASAALNERRDALLGIRSSLIPKLDEADRLFVEGRMRALAVEYEACAPDLIDLIPLDVYIAHDPKLVGRTWSERNAVGNLGEMIIKAVDGRSQIKSAKLEFSSDADKVFCETLDLSRALAENARLVAEREAREAHEEAARKLLASTERASSGCTDQTPPPVLEPAAPVREPMRFCRTRASESRREWVFPFFATGTQASRISEYAASLNVGIAPLSFERSIDMVERLSSVKRPEESEIWVLSFRTFRSDAENIARQAKEIGIVSTGIVPVRKVA